MATPQSQQDTHGVSTLQGRAAFQGTKDAGLQGWKAQLL